MSRSGPGSKAMWLRALVEPLLDDLRGDERRRADRAVLDLLRCIDTSLTEGEDIPGLRAWVTMHALPRYLEQDAYRGVDEHDHYLRMRLAIQVGRELRRSPELSGADLAVASQRIDRAWRSALERLRREQRDRRFAIDA